MGVKTLIIDEQEVSARSGQTILEVARENDINIPTLCHLDGLSDVGACRLCLVEIKGSNKLLPACVATVFEGMEVRTDTERLKKHRRIILELLFAERNHICAVCVSNGHCELQALAQEQGLTHIACPIATLSCRGCLARAVHRGPQPLHPVHPLRAGLRRD
jgi:bidirectional [NiFe] hydrogenase diaphorase subunit